jgi:hypothetical protein
MNLWKSHLPLSKDLTNKALKTFMLKRPMVVAELFKRQKRLLLERFPGVKQSSQKTSL